MNKEFLKELNTKKEPFLSVWYSLSTHMPYDYEGEKEELTEIENDYVNSLKFTDMCLKDFFEEAKKQAWYNNTLFVIVADHSHATHKNQNNFSAKYHRIPLLFFGEVINQDFKGREIKRTVSQLDVTYSLLKQIELENEASNYVWSRNLFNPYSNNLAYFCSFESGGMVCATGELSYHHSLNQIVENTFTSSDSVNQINMFAKAFQQSVFEDYRLR